MKLIKNIRAGKVIFFNFLIISILISCNSIASSQEGTQSLFGNFIEIKVFG